MNRYNIFVKLLQDRISKPPVGIDGLAFSKNIVRKYGIFIDSGRLPSLIFLRLFGGRSSQVTAHFVRSYLINNFVKCIYMQYPDVFRQFCSYFPIADKNISQEIANISIQEQGGIVNNTNITTNINNIILHEYITNKYYETGDDISFPISTTTVRAPGITLHSINSIANNYLQSFVNIRNTDSTFNKPIYPEIQYFANEKHLFRLLQIIKKNRSIADVNISQETANISIPKQSGIVNNINNTIPHEYITNKYYRTRDDISFPISTTTVRTPVITLHSINSIANNYLQRFINIRNTDSTFNKPVYPEIQYFTSEDQFFRLLQTIKKNRPIADKNIFQETANISIPEQGGIVNTNINNTIPHKYITNKYYGIGDDISFPTSTTTVRAPGITVNSINPIVSNYLQRFINIRNTGSELNKSIYPEIQYFANEKHLLRLLQIIKKNRPIADKNISQDTANISISKQGGIVNNNTNINYTIPQEHITNKYYETGDNILFLISSTTIGASRITINSINPIVSKYFKRFINIRNTGSTFNKPIYPEIQYFVNEDHFFKLLQTIKKNRPNADKKISQKTTNISIPEKGGIVNTNINTNIINTIPHEHITNTYYKTEDDISFPISSTTVRAPGITVNSINPIVSNYLQRFISIRNTGLKFNKPIYPEIQYFTNENHLFRLLQIMQKNRPIVDKKISQETANISNSQQGRIVNNTRLYNHIIKKSSEIINYFQEINNNKNIGSRVIHPLIYGLHPSFNEEELINKKIYPIQDVDLTYASEPVLNIPTSQNADIVPKKIKNIPVRSINSTGINESLIKESLPHRPVHEIHMIADKVYKIIEKKISIEKDRRGLF